MKSIILILLAAALMGGCETPQERMDNASRVCVNGWQHALFCQQGGCIPVPILSTNGKPVACHD